MESCTRRQRPLGIYKEPSPTKNTCTARRRIEVTWKQQPTMECPDCKEISYVHVDTEVFDTYKTLEYNCYECQAFGFFDEKKEEKETINGAALVIEQQMIVIDKLKEELLEVKDQVEREHQVVIAAEDFVYLETVSGVPISKDSRKKALKSLIMEVEAYEEWREEL